MGKPILFLTNAASDKVSPLAKPLQALGHDMVQMAIPASRKPTALLKAMTARFRFADYSAVITSEYARLTGLALRRAMMRSDCPIGIIGMNQSSKLMRTGFIPADRFIDRALQSVDIAIVHSQPERDLWINNHGMNPARMPFAHWGFDRPDVQSTRFSQSTDTPYVCMIGRNNRDFQTFCDAVAAAGLRGIIIASAQNDLNFRKPECVSLELDLSMDECVDCIRGSIANVILVQDASRGAGHITAVAALHLGKPTVFTADATLDDYLADGSTGIAVPLKDVAATTAALRNLANDPALCAKMKEQGQSYAARWLTTDAVAKVQADLIDRAIRGLPLPSTPEGWHNSGANSI